MQKVPDKTILATAERLAPECWERIEVNMTRLAEMTAQELDHDEWLDDENHYVWEAAHEAAQRYERMMAEETYGID